MKTFQEFIKQLQETPQLSTYYTPLEIENHVVKNDVENLAAKSIKIGNDSHYYFDKDQNEHVYFHKNHKGLPEEVNYITKDNVQRLVAKRRGDVKNNINHMIHHIKKFGELKTSGSQSPGGKNLWINFIKSNPKNIKFECNSQELNHTNIDHHAFDLWDTSMRNSDKIIRAYHDNT